MPPSRRRARVYRTRQAMDGTIGDFNWDFGEKKGDEAGFIEICEYKIGENVKRFEETF